MWVVTSGEQGESNRWRDFQKGLEWQRWLVESVCPACYLPPSGSGRCLPTPRLPRRRALIQQTRAGRYSQASPLRSGEKTAAASVPETATAATVRAVAPPLIFPRCRTGWRRPASRPVAHQARERDFSIRVRTLFRRTSGSIGLSTKSSTGRYASSGPKRRDVVVWMAVRMRMGI